MTGGSSLRGVRHSKLVKWLGSNSKGLVISGRFTSDKFLGVFQKKKLWPLNLTIGNGLCGN